MRVFLHLCAHTSSMPLKNYPQLSRFYLTNTSLYLTIRDCSDAAPTKVRWAIPHSIQRKWCALKCVFRNMPPNKNARMSLEHNTRITWICINIQHSLSHTYGAGNFFGCLHWRAKTFLFELHTPFLECVIQPAVKCLHHC